MDASETNDNRSPERADGGAEDLVALRAAAAQAAEMKDRWVRSAAELQNAQRRFAREKELACRLTVRDFLRALLPSFDNLGRALAAPGAAATKDPVVQGVRMVHGEIHRVLGDLGVAVISPGRERLDPNLHEAISRRAESGVDENTILEVHEKGYRLGDLVIRPARVIVAAAPAAPGSESGGTGGASSSGAAGAQPVSE